MCEENVQGSENRILMGEQWTQVLVWNSQPGDSLFFQFSGVPFDFHDAKHLKTPPSYRAKILRWARLLNSRRTQL
jgi:hypothetical protein